jgi:urease accessory protein
MVCVGVVSATLGKRAIWTVPSAFVAAMAVGGILGLNAYTIRHTELAIAASLVALGLVIAAAKTISIPGVTLPTWLAMAFVVAFGAAHGNAHGTEIPATANPISFTAGFLLGTTGLHLAGVFTGMSATKHRWSEISMRLAGMFTAAIGAGLLTR